MIFDMKNGAELREIFMQLNLENQKNLLADARQLQAGQVEGGAADGGYIRNEDGAFIEKS